MSGILGIATSGLLSFKHAIDVGSQNIVNANTEGYSRLTTTLGTLNSQRFGNFHLGSGVNVSNIERVSDLFVQDQIYSGQTALGELSAYLGFAQSLDGLLAESSTSLSISIQGFFSSLQQVADEPASLVAREAALTQGELLTDRFQLFERQLFETKQNINQALSGRIKEINTLANNIGQINLQALNSGSPPPELLDQREKMLSDLSKLINITSYEQGDGSINVAIGNGQTLVSGSTVTSLTTIQDPLDPTESKIAYNINGNTFDITDNLSGGEIGGLLRFNNEVLKPAINNIGQIALGLAEQFNLQHQEGMDLNDNLGGLFFTDINSATAQATRVLVDQANTGNAQMAVQIDDSSQLTKSDYLLEVTAGPNYRLTRLSDNTVTNFAGLPQSFDGLTLSVPAGAAAVGDRFLVAPTRNGSRDINMAITDPNNIAAAFPFRTVASSNNSGAGVISDGDISNINNPFFTTTAGQLAPPLRIEFLTPTSYQVVNATTSGVIEGPIAYNPSSQQAIFPTPGAYDPGIRINISGQVAAGDQFSVEYNNGGSGDGRNLAELTSLRDQKSLDNGNASYIDSYAALVANSGSRSAQAQLSSNAAEVLLQQSLDKRDSISGVNLDEETAELLKFEQSYQAASRLISIADRMFNSFLDSIG
jgi:flagellar hook-associated protein 1